MNYQKVYNDLIHSRQTTVIPNDIYSEKHHIVPKCVGGTNENSNLVRLTAREHYIAHLLLAKIYNNIGLHFTVVAMGKCNSVNNRQFKINSRIYQHLKEEFSVKQSENKKGQEPWNKGLQNCFSEESILKMKQSHKNQIPWNKGKTGLQIPWNKGSKGLQVAWNKGVPMDENSKIKMSKTKTGKKLAPCSESRKQKISAANKGRKRTEEQKQRMREARLKYLENKNKGK